ncbi:MAG: hypothetical protein LN412_07890, partial [Candidatus Thermoplasmatota archaeon]|nr:hypothetical protein [Candidatus Thermoplasmatota archaeon]
KAGHLLDPGLQAGVLCKDFAHDGLGLSLPPIKNSVLKGELLDQLPQHADSSRVSIFNAWESD